MEEIKATYYFSIFTFLLMYIIALAIIYLIRRRKNNNKYRFGFIAIFTLYILVLINTTFFPIVVATEHAGYDVLNTCIQLEPLHTIKGYFDGFTTEVQITGNILLLMPLAVFIGVTQKNRIAGSGIATNLLYCITASIIIEVSQFIINMVSHFPNRVVDIDDVILNGTGTLVAAIICFGFMKTKLYQNKMKKLIYK